MSYCRGCGHDDAVGLPFHYIWQAKRFDGVRCRACGLVRLDPMPTADELTLLYGQEYFDNALHGLDRAGVDYEALHDANLASTMAFVEREILSRAPGAASPFEVGAAMGHLLSCARERGLRCGGIEISRAAVATAHKKFRLDLICGDVASTDLSAEAGRWDIVYAGDVLEHMTDPRTAIQVMHSLLVPGGVLVLRVPATMNLLSTRLALMVYGFLRKSVRLPDGPYHVHEFTPKTLSSLVGAFFFDVRVVQDIVPISQLNLKSGSVAYRAKWLIHLMNVPITRLVGVWGDRLLLVAKA